ncbi:membrane integrity-associated transporter subunit PqiC [Neomegalonema sp.]|uniref:PqiC family protein n=1 Tax=Neomegalonema sp. TaxID=2039713 RepID=UPI002619A41A|nr:PqiC family protein [Neomegalonema sp.]MDD2867999.1 PqiC family protein [Neomegalonema sp.]
MNRRLLLGSATACLLLAGCGGGSAPQGPFFHLLPPAPAPQALGAPLAGMEVGLREVRLPRYAVDERLSILQPDGVALREEYQRWAEDPTRAVSQNLAEALRAASGAAVALEPWASGFEPDRRVEVEFTRLIGAPGGMLEAAGVWRVLEGRRGREILSEPFRLDLAVGPGYEGLMRAHAASLGDLAELLAQALARSGPLEPAGF